MGAGKNKMGACTTREAHEATASSSVDSVDFETTIRGFLGQGLVSKALEACAAKVGSPGLRDEQLTEALESIARISEELEEINEKNVQGLTKKLEAAQKSDSEWERRLRSMSSDIGAQWEKQYAAAQRKEQELEAQVESLQRELEQVREDKDRVILGLREELDEVSRVPFCLPNEKAKEQELVAKVESLQREIDQVHQAKDLVIMDLVREKEEVCRVKDMVIWGLRHEKEEANRVLAATQAQLNQLQAQAPAPAGNPVITEEEILTRMAHLECGPVWEAEDTEKPTLRRKILAKWHPDRQASDGNKRLANRVFQELQSSLMWEEV